MHIHVETGHFLDIYMAAILFLLDLTAWQLHPRYVAIKSSMI